jgi:hypothetical protein
MLRIFWWEYRSEEGELNCVGLKAMLKIIFHKMEYLAYRTKSIIYRRILDNETLL